jgi:SnoaL-like domain
MDFDQTISWRGLEERLARTDDPRHRRMLQTVIDHAKAESYGDVDGLMATLGDDPQYHFWSGGTDWGPKGADAVRAYYRDFVASGAGFFESYKARIVVDDDNVVTESVMRQLVPGRVAQQRGYDIPDVDAHYIVSARTAIFWPFDESCTLIAEDSYGSSDLRDLTLVPDDELPADYVAMLDAIGQPLRTSAPRS